MTQTIDTALKNLMDKDDITVVVADSGLGGISIFAEIDRRLRETPLFSRVRLVYFNAWPEQDRGYNRLPSTDERIRVFDCALNGMMRFSPDIIMIACNTLSVLYDRTPFSRTAQVPVIDIVDFGVDMIAGALAADPASRVIILGTLTTVAEGVHRDRLVARGADAARIAGQPCDQLATKIEQGPGTPPVVELVEKYTAQAARLFSPRPASILAALCCTHFGYSAGLIRERLSDHAGCPVTILDPNRHMAGYLFAFGKTPVSETASVSLRVVSRILWSDTQMTAIAGAVNGTSPDTARALEAYEHIPDLFTF